MEYKHEVKTVISNNIVIGFIARSYVIYGMVQEIPISWCVTKSLVCPMWEGGFATRKEAREHLEALFTIRELPQHWEINTKRKYDA